MVNGPGDDEETNDAGTRNEVSGQVSGGVVQARNIGTVNIGSPPPSPARIPRQLPARPRDFVNRTQELALLDGVLHSGPAVAVISGLKGVGKSAVSHLWAHQAQERFRDGQLYVDFKALRHRGGAEVSGVLAGFLRALGVHESWIPAELSERAGMFRSLTADLRLLVLVDDAEHAAEVTPLCPASTGSAVVVTSHRQLGELLVAGAKPVRIAPLEEEQGVSLLAGMLGEDRVAAEHDRAGELVRLCGGLPIALRVAGARLAQRPAWKIARMVGDLVDADRRLDHLATEGRAIVEAVFQSAYEGLPEGAAHLYRLLSAIPGADFPLGVVRVVLADGADRADRADRALDSLLDANLIEEIEGARYRFHDLVRLHAVRCGRQRESAREREAALRRVTEWYLGQVVAADAAMGPRLRLADQQGRLSAVGRPFRARGEALDWLDAERMNVLAIVRAAAAREWDDVVWQVAEALWPFHHDRGYYADWLEINRLGVEAALRIGELAVEARMRNQLARAHVELGAYDQAREELRHARQAALAAGDRRMEAVVLESLGRAALAQSEPDEAVEHFAAALAIHEEAGNARGVGLQSYHLGLAHNRAGRHSEAIAALERALPGMPAGDRAGQGRIHLGLGEAHRGLGHHERAVRSAETAAALLSESGVPVREMEAWELLAELAGDVGDRESARAHLGRALAVCLASGNVPKADVLRARLAATS
ncbi:tetratricopeptide repeat protein [Nonomuraea turkmeniaca]|uniref:Tetratricopeptide repeat protein n=1 Tax=Nonomuraea turkmeniaca TaxID=103838 RepID=A0A5S4FNF2_9ACTN|nr:tetratricopeptide repeat protein [Nonomuraea turkmeniaca]TMR22212.1 tetratricopeptide repeat protein [Nonomuraea turkmeniaca]